jgi:hypothetical protein
VIMVAEDCFADARIDVPKIQQRNTNGTVIERISLFFFFYERAICLFDLLENDLKPAGITVKKNHLADVM